MGADVALSHLMGIVVVKLLDFSMIILSLMP